MESAALVGISQFALSDQHYKDELDNDGRVEGTLYIREQEQDNIK
jgi:hypothetical protein